MNTKDDILSQAIEISNEERDKNNELSEKIVEKIFEDANISQYEDIDTVVTMFVRVRKWNNILSHWWTYQINLTKLHDAYDIRLAKICIDSICDSLIDN